jgi:hypothetical protein
MYIFIYNSNSAIRTQTPKLEAGRKFMQELTTSDKGMGER